MKVKNFLKGKRVVYSFMAGALVVLLLLAGLPACAPAAEEEAPPVEEEGPVVEETAYDKYVASLSEGEYPVPQDCFDQAIEEGQVNVYDWAEWWPEEIYTNFEKEFGINIVRDNYASEPEVVAKFKLNPQTPYDAVDCLAARSSFQMIHLNVLQELNHDWIPNVNENIGESFLEFEYDPGAKYSIILDYGSDTYWYNSKYVDDSRMPSWAVLFEPDEKYKGKITLVDDMFKSLAGALAYLGYPVNSDDEEQLMEVRDLMMNLKPYVMSFDSWPKRLALEEEAWILQGTYGDGFILDKESGGVVTARPATEGSRLLTDTLSIPIGAPHPAAGHLWINYLFRPHVSALLCGGIGVQPCCMPAVEFLPEDAQEWWAQVPEGYVAGCGVIDAKALTGIGLELRSEIWEELKS